MLPVRSNPEFYERRTKNAEQKIFVLLHLAQRKCSIQRRYASETSVMVLICSSFVVLSSSFVFNTLAPKGLCLAYPKAILGKLKTAWDLFFQAVFVANTEIEPYPYRAQAVFCAKA